MRLTLFALLAVSAAGSALAQPSPSAPPPPTAQATNAALPFLQLAGESDVYEVTSGEIALLQSGQEPVQAFARMLMEHHTQTTDTVLERARNAGIDPPPAVLGPTNRARIDDLLAAPPEKFDEVFIAQQVFAHERALALHETYARNGDQPELQKAAAAAVPIVTAHLKMAQAMQAELRP